MTLLYSLFRPWRGPLTAGAPERTARAVLLAAYVVGIFAISSIPGSSLSPPVDDRIAHTLEYFVLSVLALLVVAGFSAPLRPVHYVWTLLAVAAFAASDEFHQSFVPMRDSSVKDTLFDILGSLMGTAMIWIGTRERRT